MIDTHPNITAEVEKRMRNLSGAERFAMGIQMFETARQMVIASFNSHKKSTTELRVKLFLRFYGNDFDEQARSVIVEHLRR